MRNALRPVKSPGVFTGVEGGRVNLAAMRVVLAKIVAGIYTRAL